MDGFGRRGSLGGLPTPRVVLCAGVMHSALVPCFCYQHVTKWQLGFGIFYLGFPGGLAVENLPTMQETWV